MTRYETFTEELTSILHRAVHDEGDELDTTSRNATPQAMSEINVVPYIDVMLVLLVIFMVTAPMLTQACRSICRRRRRSPFPNIRKIRSS